MKKILFSLTLFVAFSFSLSAQMVLQAKFTGLGQYDNIQREKLNKSGEKFRIYFNDKKTVFYNANGSVWKTIDSSVIKQTPCTKAIWNGSAFANTYKSTDDIEFFYKCQENGAIGVADENGKSFFNTNEAVSEFARDANGVSTISKGSIFGGDSLKTFKYYSNNNGILTLSKTLTETWTAWSAYSPVTQYNEKNLFQITKDRKVNIFDLNWKLLSSTPIPALPTGCKFAVVENISQKLFNTDDKWEFSLLVFDKDYKISNTIFDETGKKLIEFTGSYPFPNYNSTGTRMSLADPSTGTSTLYELPGLNVLKVYNGKEFFAGFDSKGQVIKALNNYSADKTYSLFTEKGTLIKKVKIDDIAGYDYKGTDATIDLPNNANIFMHIYSLTGSTNNKYLYRVAFPDGKTQDFKDYDSYSFEKLYGADLLLYLNKLDDKNVKTTEIYNFGKYVGTAEAAETLTGVSVYPNPFEDKMVVELKNEEQGLVKVSLTNQLGQIVDSKESNETSITMNGYGSYAKGIYFLTIEQNGKKSIQKVVKN